MIEIPRKGDTIPHEILGVYGAAKVLLKPATPGTGIIAGGPVRALCEACGLKDIRAKRLGSANANNVIKAAINGFLNLSTKKDRFESEE
jgi:small subunit ribosomal protein S5